jgi:hypothetical protein
MQQTAITPRPPNQLVKLAVARTGIAWLAQAAAEGASGARHIPSGSDRRGSDVEAFNKAGQAAESANAAQTAQVRLKRQHSRKWRKGLLGDAGDNPACRPARSTRTTR